jgi:predicted CopG family antitoxin
MPPKLAAPKVKKTFSLSRESVKYLESLRDRKRAESVSSVLEELIRQQREALEMERISASVSSYYDSLPDERAAEDRAWGEFAESQFPTDK